MRKLTLLSALLLVGVLLTTTSSWAQSYKFKSTPHAVIQSGQTTVDQIYVPTNVKLANVRVGLFAKTVYYGSLRIVLTSPTGYQVVLKTETANGTNYFGSLGSERSYALFQDGGATVITNSPPTQPNDRPIAPTNLLANLTGRDAMGWWTLQVIDTRNTSVTPYQNGWLEGWYLVFNSVLKEPEIVLWEQVKTGSQLIGQLNGVIQTVPNDTATFGGAVPLCGAGTNPNVTPGQNGEAYPFVVANLGYPGLLIGQPVPGYTTGGRFKVTVDISTNIPPPGNPSPALTGDIAVYFGRVASFTAPLQSPPSPAKFRGGAAQWPRGGGNFTNTLQGGNGLQGGVRLSACNSEQASPWGLSGADLGGYIDCSFDDLALISIETAETCLLGDGVCGTFKPETPLSALNGNPVEGLYYITVYDTYADRPFSAYGHVRVIGLRVQYLAGGGEIANPNFHEGIAGPLLGVPIPGKITGAMLGYLPDVVTTIPPYSVHAKDQDPMLFFWGVQKMGPRTAIGWENLHARNGTTYTSIAGDGPYAYPGTLDANPAVAGLTVNADLGSLPVGSYYLRSTLSQQRYDDDNTDNFFESAAPVQVTNTSMSYIGEKINQADGFNGGSGSGIYISLPMQPNTANASGLGNTFTVFKYPYTSVTSVDYKFDRGLVVNQVWRTPLRISVWRCATGYTGAPVGPPVAKSKTIATDEWLPGNWRSFPLYACDAAGNITTTPTASLPPGTYAVMLDNMGTANAMIYPYSWGMLPFMNYRYWDFQFNETFGPLGPFSALGTRFVYSYISSGTAAPSGGMSALSTTNTWGNWILPMRLNTTTLNDFAIDYLSINGTKGTEAVSILTAPFQPNVIVTAASLQGGNTKDFNARLEIFDTGNNRVYLSDVNYGPQGTPQYPGINPYQTVSVPMAQWNPATAGLYKVKAFFSRKPEDQNPVNDEHEFMLYVSATRAILATGANASSSDINNALSALREKGVTAEVMNANDSRIAAAKGMEIYLVGNVDDKAVISKAIANGNNVAFVYNRKDNFGKLLQVVDNVYSIERPGANYDKMTLFPEMKELQLTSKQVAPANPPVFTTKEELVAQVKALRAGVEPVVNDNPVPETTKEQIEQMIPVETATPYGALQSVDMEVGDIGILYTVPENRKAGRVTVDEALPTGFALEQNFPNPFNPTTSISYMLPQNSFVTLRVTDMLGREVMTLVNTTQDAGRYSIVWKGTDQFGEAVASGNYICRIDATPVLGGSTFSSQVKMTLSK